MTKAQVIALCVEVIGMPYCQLIVYDEEALEFPHTLTHQAYLAEMMRDRPWSGPAGLEAYYDDEASEPMQEAWYKAAAQARAAIREWEANHKGSIPVWAKRL